MELGSVTRQMQNMEFRVRKVRQGVALAMPKAEPKKSALAVRAKAD